MHKKLIQFLNIGGIIIMLLLVLLCVPLTLPRLFGYQLYAVKTPSMTPIYPVGSVLYVKPCGAGEVQIGDPITFTMGTDTDMVMTHRVVAIDQDKQTFTTKGDANTAEDITPVGFDRLIGKPVLCLNGMAGIADYIHSIMGAITLALLFFIVLMSWLIADQLNKKNQEIPVMTKH